MSLHSHCSSCCRGPISRSRCNRPGGVRSDCHLGCKKSARTKELAEALDCDPQTIVNAAKAGKIPFRIDKEFRFDPAAVRIALCNNARSKK